MAIIHLLFTLIPTALAQATGGSAGAPSFLVQAFPFIALFVIFYFFMIRPQVRKQKEHAQFLGQLKVGDEVLTSSGIFGTIRGLTDKFVTLEVAEDVKIRVLRSQVHATAKEG